jgi:hypothetical protein
MPLLICLSILFICSGTSVIFFCVWSFNLTCVSGKNNKLKMLPEDKGELTPVHTLWWVCLLYITIDIPEIYRICLLKWQEEQEMDPCTLCPATENHTKITSPHPPTHHTTWSFICIFKPENLFHFFTKCFFHNHFQVILPSVPGSPT